MSDSLKDQLISLGLAKEPPRRRKKPGPKPGATRGGKPGARNKEGEISLDEAYRRKQQSEKQSAEETKRRKRAEDERRRRLNKELQAIVDAHKLNDPKAELKRNFVYKGRIRSVLVNEKQLKKLNAGELALVFLRGSYFVVLPEVAEQVRALSPDHVPDLAGGAPDDEGDHPVPDDLVW